MENRDVFLAAGGEKYSYIPALNGRADHVAALRALALRDGGRRRQPVPGVSACFG